MYNYIRTTTVLLGLLVANALASQTAEPAKDNQIPNGILRIGYAPVNQVQSSFLAPGINIDWEKPLSANFTLGLNLYRDLSKSTRFRFDERSIVGDLPTRPEYEYSDIRTSLSLNAVYYFKPYAYDGFYAAFRLNNLLAETVNYGDYLLDMRPRERSIVSKPRMGVYLGYRKVFDKGFFIDGAAGVIMNPVQSRTMLKTKDYLDFKFSFGWQLGWRKGK